MTSNWLDLQNDFSYVLNGSRNSALANHQILTYIFICSCSSTHFSWKDAHPRSMLHHPTLALPSSSLALTVTKHMLSRASSWGGGVHAMNNVILTKWRIALSIGHRSAWESLKNSSTAKIMISSECNTQWIMPFFFSCLNHCNSFSCYRASLADSYTDRRKS